MNKEIGFIFHPFTKELIVWFCTLNLFHKMKASKRKVNETEDAPVKRHRPLQHVKDLSCLRKKIDAKDSLGKRFPHLVKEWHPTENGGWTPYDFSAGTRFVATWQCTSACKELDGTPSPDCEHKWNSEIGHRARGSKCPYCTRRSSRPCCAKTSLASEEFRAFAVEWHPTKNGSLTPRDFYPKSRENVWWTCANVCPQTDPDAPPCVHEWNARISTRTYGGHGCSHCSTHGGGTSLSCCLGKSAVSDPRFSPFASEWDYEKNTLKPEELKIGSSQPVWWKCQKVRKRSSSGKAVRCLHSFTASIERRVFSRLACKGCSGSIAERCMNDILFSLKKRSQKVCEIGIYQIRDIERNFGLYESAGPKGGMQFADFSLRLDLTLKNKTQESRWVIIELDGPQHFRTVQFSYDLDVDALLEDVKSRDASKTAWCIQHRIPLLRISHSVKNEHYEAIILRFLDAAMTGKLATQCVGPEYAK